MEVFFNKDAFSLSKTVLGGDTIGKHSVKATVRSVRASHYVSLEGEVTI